MTLPGPIRVRACILWLAAGALPPLWQVGAFAQTAPPVNETKEGKSPSPASESHTPDPRGASVTPKSDAALSVGPLPGGGMVVPTSQLLHPAGDTIEFPSRPVDLAISPDEAWIYVKDNRGLLVVDAAKWTIAQTLPFPRKNDGGSMVGLAVSADGTKIYVTSADGFLSEALRGADGMLTWGRQIEMPKFNKGTAFPCGVTISKDATTAYVCLSRSNALITVDLTDGTVGSTIPVGVAPYEVRLSEDGKEAMVSNWGGRPPHDGELSALSSGTLAMIDARGIASSGTLSTIDLVEKVETSQVNIGRSASAVLRLQDGGLAVAATNEDAVMLRAGQSWRAISTRPQVSLPFGSMPNGLAQVPAGAHSLAGAILVSNAGNNAIGVIQPGEGAAHDTTLGFIPTAWYPGGVIATRTHIYVACINGVGARTPHADEKGWNSHWHRGTLSRIPLPDAAQLARYTEQSLRDARVPQTLLAMDHATTPAEAVPVPAAPGQKSLFQHVLYIIKENRTFDQIYGDFGRGNADPSLCVFGAEATPNQHALSERFGLLDNFYCNGVLSADGHSWATEGISTPYLQRSFGGFERSYTFGNDPLTYSSAGFVWDHVLAAGFTFRNYGEFDEAGVKPKGNFFEVFEDLKSGAGKYTITHDIGVANVRHYSCPDAPGWNLAIPDQHRADVFLRELAQFEKTGDWPAFMTLYLPNDHTNGTGKGTPTPRAMVADNDLALGRIVDAITHSKYWSTTCILVVEDDPQNGFDHVDGHRSTCLVISPYSKRGSVISDFYNQASVIHTIEHVFGLPAPNQLSAMAPVMTTCFAATPDLEPFTHLPNRIPLDERNSKADRMGPDGPTLAEATEKLDFTKPDQADEDTLNRIVWHSVYGTDKPYPAQWAGAHGRGLAALGLRLATGDEKPDDDDDDQ